MQPYILYPLLKSVSDLLHNGLGWVSMHAVARLAAGRIRILTTHFLRLISMEAGSGSTTASSRRAVVAESNSARLLNARVLNRVHGNPA